jgi:uncharacterized protein DUF2752
VARRLLEVGAPFVSMVAIVALAGVLRLPLCLAASLGLSCPGCGLSRAALALARGDVAAAMHHHPLSPIAVPLLALAVGWLAATYVVTGRARHTRLCVRVILVAALALVVVWAVGITRAAS